MFKDETDLERLVSRLNIDHEACPLHREKLRVKMLSAFDEAGRQLQKQNSPQGVIRRTIMRSSITKLAAAAVIIVAIGLGMYVLTGSIDGASITLAQIRQAAGDIDWMQIVSGVEEAESLWLSFGSKLEIVIGNDGKIVYSDFKTRKRFAWERGGRDIHESSIDEHHDRGQFLGGASGPFDLLDSLFGSLLTAEKGYEITKTLGSHQDREVEVWVARRTREKPGSTRTEITTVYIDIDKKLPVAFTEQVEEADGKIRIERSGEFRYPQTGPADIYQAGAPRSAQIKPPPEL